MITHQSNVREVAENIYSIRLPMPFDLNHINVYVLKETNRLALVDCGLNDAPSWEALNGGLQHLGMQLADLTDVFVTHFHPDHIGQFNKIRQHVPEARLFFHKIEYNWMEGRVHDSANRAKIIEEWAHKHGADFIDGERLVKNGAEYFPELQAGDKLVEGGERVQFSPTDSTAEWEVLWTPGHTPGHFVLINRQRGLMFSGDHLLHTISSNIGKFPGSTPDPLGEYMNSLKIIADLDLKEVLPAHGQTFTNYRERAHDLIKHHHERLDKIAATLEKEPRTAAQVIHGIWGDRLQGFNRYLALVEVLSHLERLKLDGRVVAEEGQQIYWRLT